MKKGDKFNLGIEIAVVDIVEVDDQHVDVKLLVTDQSWPSDKGAPRLQYSTRLLKNMLEVEQIAKLGASQAIKNEILKYSAIGVMTVYRDRLASQKKFQDDLKLLKQLRESEKHQSIEQQEGESNNGQAIDEMIELKEQREMMSDKLDEKDNTGAL